MALTRNFLRWRFPSRWGIGTSSSLFMSTTTATSSDAKIELNPTTWWPKEGSPVAKADHYFTWDVRTPVKIHMGDEYPCDLPPITIPRMIRMTVENYGGCLALADRRGPANEWKKWTYEEYHEESRSAAKGFLELGLERFGGVGILGRNSPEWFMSSVGAVTAGGLTVGLYATNSPETNSYIGGHAPFHVFCVEDEGELRRVLDGRALAEAFPTVRKVVLTAPGATATMEEAMTWEELLRLGRASSGEALRRVEEEQVANEACALVYTSVILSHDNITGISKASTDHMGFRRGQEVLLSYLPPCHVASLVVDEFMFQHIGAAVYFADRDALKGKLVEDLKEVRPTVLIAVPRVFEKIEERLREMGKKGGGLRRKVMDWAKGAAAEHHRAVRAQGQELKGSFSYRLARSLILRNLQKALGLDNACKGHPAGIYVGGAPLRISTYYYFESLDIPLLQAYGSSETTCPITTNLQGPRNVPGSVGHIGNGATVEIDNPDPNGLGEVLNHGRNVFMGYHKEEEKTREVFTEDNYYRTGDLGKFDDNGYLHIEGRLKEIIITSGGKNVAPAPVEEAVKRALPEVVSYAVVVGDQRNYLSCLLTLIVEVDQETMQPTDRLAPSVRKWAAKVLGREKAEELRTVEDFLSCPGADKLKAALYKGIERANASASSNVSKVRKMTVLPRELSVTGGELSPTLKVKRFYLMQKYADLIEDMYSTPSA